MESLDGGALGPERKLYLRELVARFGYQLALNWNLGEENTQSPAQQRAMAGYIREPRPLHASHRRSHAPAWPGSVLPAASRRAVGPDGASLQNDWNEVHARTLKWLAESRKAGRPWVVANDEQGTRRLGVPPDPGYKGFAGKDPAGVPFRRSTTFAR